MISSTGQRHERVQRPQTLDVHPRQRPPQAVLDLAAHQDGVVTREQALGLGLTDPVIQRLLREYWQSLARGIYLTTNKAPDWPALAWGGVLAGGDHSRLGASASGWLYGLLPAAPEPIDVLVPQHLHPTPGRHWTFRRERPGVRQLRTVGSPPRLGVEDTVLDLAAAASEGEVISLVATAIQRRLTTIRRLRSALEGRARHPHRKLLTAALSDVAAGARSVLEARYLHDVERAHGLPIGQRQQTIRRQRYETDVHYEQFLTLVELDGAAYHSGLAAFVDMDRDNVHALLNRLTLRFGWVHVVGDPCRVAAIVARALSDRGWRGVPTRCPRCQLLPDQDWDELCGVVA